MESGAASVGISSEVAGRPSRSLNDAGWKAGEGPMTTSGERPGGMSETSDWRRYFARLRGGSSSSSSESKQSM